jgi:hypothetical protein
MPDKKILSPKVDGSVVCQVLRAKVVEPQRAIGERVMTASGMVMLYPGPKLINTLEFVSQICVVTSGF